ncbi:hypothetical protein AMJ40_00755 [candidate division TA06 bacterium DG_26]|uniref:tRNA dimethylallyltransferase n=1 Tax=candidate division TA06 bacterium DG_26 TaxID=1703771 RepID=A0A0S7WLW5_UNCT6|nr:MAG: hypothetical protein AMJ40_00755 [candidate division TA06 bacterium DG_26]
MSLSQDLTPIRRIGVVVGPTGVGKTEVGIEVARSIGAEIVSADSRQIYKYMDIGTAKPSVEQRRSVPHWMIDLVEPDVDYSAARYGEEAREVIDGLLASGRRVLLVGGSGLYIQALLESFFPAPPVNHELRSRLITQGRSLGTKALHSRLTRVDPHAAARIHPNDLKRLVRALEVYETTGIPISKQQQGHTSRRHFSSLYIGLHREKEDLKRRIEWRVDKMIERGLVEEVQSILRMGYSKDLNSLNTLGYKEVIAHLSGELGLKETTALIKKHTRAYAKRQLTWFKRIPDVQWVDLSETKATPMIAATIERFLDSPYGSQERLLDKK